MSRNKTLNPLLFLILLGAFGGTLKAQDDSLSQVGVETLLQLKPVAKQLSEIEIASKESESLFEAPLGVSVLSREEIERAGCLSIMEALRLLPGVLVRETSAGNYDINIRGFNNTPPGSDLYAADNSNSLVMIDYRPVFNYFSGGTFWESLPISIQDIDRIELVRGPASALYGSNAVTGVINIITQKIAREGVHTRVLAEYGNQETFRGNFAASYAPNPRWQFAGSFNYTQRGRSSDEFYSFLQNEYLNPLNEGGEIISYQTGAEISGRSGLFRKYPDPDIGIKRYGANVFVNYQPKEDIAFQFSAGLEDSYTNRPFAENGYTPLSAMISNTNYFNLRSLIKGGTVQVSYLSGSQEPGLESIGSKLDLDIWDIQADYNFKIGDLNIKPGISFKRSIYDDRAYVPEDLGETDESGIINGRANIDILSPSLRLDYKLNNLRLIASGRMEKFNVPDQAYYSYQAIANYTIQKKHLLRVVYAQANRGAFVSEVLSNFQDVRQEVQPGVFLQTLANGNPNLDLLTSRSFELGYRFQASQNFFLDAEFFRSDAKDFTSLILDVDTTFSNSGLVLFPTFNQTNLPARVFQNGFTLSIQYQNKQNFQGRVFMTVQETEIRDFSPFNQDPELDPTGNNNYLALSNIDNYKGTPRLFGGMDLNYSFRAFNLNMNAYYFSEHRLTHLSDISLGREITEAVVKSSLIMNAKITYQPVRQCRVYLNMRNLLGQDEFEYIFTDPISSIFSIGFQLEL